MDEYAKAIVEEYNRWAARYREAVKDWSGAEEIALSAFMCNAINAAVSGRARPEVREYFEAHADYD